MGHTGAHQHGSTQWEQAGWRMEHPADHTWPCHRWEAPGCPPAHHLAEHPLLQSPQLQFSVFGTVLSHCFLHTWHQEVMSRTGGIPQPLPPAAWGHRNRPSTSWDGDAGRKRLHGSRGPFWLGTEASFGTRRENPPGV